MDSPGQLDGLLAAPGSRDHVCEGAGDVVALGAELLGQFVGPPEAVCLYPHLPRGIAALEELLLDVRLLGLVVPALLVPEPALGHEPGRGQALVVQLALDDAGLTPTRLVTERWLGDEERWDDEPAAPDAEEELLERGYAPWEVRVEADSLSEAHDLAEELRAEGYDVSRTFTYVIAGTGTREDAVELARRIHGRVEPGGELVYEVQPGNPFAVFGGLGT